MEGRMKITLKQDAPEYMRDAIREYFKNGGSDLVDAGNDPHHLLMVPKEGCDGIVDVGSAYIAMSMVKEFVSLCEEWVGIEIDDNGDVYETDFLKLLSKAGARK